MSALISAANLNSPKLRAAALMEPLAAAEHESWASWMKWLFKVSHQNEDGSVLISARDANHWKDQANTAYRHLSENEKEMDREEVRKILPLIEAAMED